MIGKLIEFAIQQKIRRHYREKREKKKEEKEKKDADGKPIGNSKISTIQ